MLPYRLQPLLLGIFVICLILPQEVHSSSGRITDLITNGSYGLANASGSPKKGYNLDHPFIPASIIKIITAQEALQVLGPTYRFRTRFYLDKNNALYIQGTGDPLLLSEDIERITSQLRLLGLQDIRALYIDSSLYALETLPPGSESSDNPYDAPVTATAVNFNSLPVFIPYKGKVESSEPQTPFIPFMQELGKQQAKGKYRLNICTNGCNQDRAAARYTAELFQAFFRENNIRVKATTGIKKVPKNARLVYRHTSEKNVQEVVRQMLLCSSNFIANQLFLTCGAARYGYPATWEKGRNAIKETLVHELGESQATTVTIMDGAGLSRKNRITARQMLQMLQVFSPYANLLHKQNGVLLKSGTMTDIYNYAGFFSDGTAYVIMLNQKQNTRGQLLDYLKTNLKP